MDVKTLCLGLLSLEEACGYELKKNIEMLFKHFFPAGYGSIYPALADLAEEGLVECQDMPRVNGPARKVYGITPAGRRHFKDKLDKETPTHKLRSDFLVMMFFSDQIDTKRLKVLLDKRINEFHNAASQIERMADDRAGGSPGRARFVAGFSQAVAQAAASYIEENRHLLEGRPVTPPVKKHKETRGLTVSLEERL